MISVLIGGEGKRDSMFLNHIVTLYGVKSVEFKVTIYKGNGGGPYTVANDFKKKAKIGSYDKTLLLLDSDLSTTEIPTGWIKDLSMSLIESQPMCLEGLFLDVLDDLPRGANSMASSRLKSRFHKNYCGTDKESEANKRLLRGRMDELFPKELLESKRGSIPELDMILKFLGV